MAGALGRRRSASQGCRRAVESSRAGRRSGLARGEPWIGGALDRGTDPGTDRRMYRERVLRARGAAGGEDSQRPKAVRRGLSADGAGIRGLHPEAGDEAVRRCSGVGWRSAADLDRPDDQQRGGARRGRRPRRRRRPVHARRLVLDECLRHGALDQGRRLRRRTRRDVHHGRRPPARPELQARPADVVRDRHRHAPARVDGRRHAASRSSSSTSAPTRTTRSGSDDDALALLGRTVWLPTVEDVIITKLRWAAVAGRSKDRDDARDVIAVQDVEGAIDWDYVHAWCDRHGTRGLLDEVRRSIPPSTAGRPPAIPSAPGDGQPRSDVGRGRRRPRRRPGSCSWRSAPHRLRRSTHRLSSGSRTIQRGEAADPRGAAASRGVVGDGPLGRPYLSRAVVAAAGQGGLGGGEPGDGDAEGGAGDVVHARPCGRRRRCRGRRRARRRCRP